ncbi:hypothetical protein Ciccas_012956 [Cichlidogyrus casuarinus]|uniref:DUF4781 domain-containing protein n=1 Tax=Cichlidogyrus casuarinus TaxID=1844966 RepID=A0ABD2PNQ0_9PLAT
MDASNFSQYKKYVDDLFSRHGSSFGAADFDQIFDENHSFHEDLLTHLKRLFATNELQLQLLEKLDRSCINPLRLKVAYLMFGAPELTEEKTLHTEKEQEVIDKVCATIENQYSHDEVLFNCLYAITRNRRSKLAYYHILFKVRNPDLTMSRKVSYIDRESRIYPSWENFLQNNKLSPLHNDILIPEKGKYVYKVNGKVCKEPKGNFRLNKVNKILTYTGTVVSTTAVAAWAVAIGAIAVTAVSPLIWIAAGVLVGVSGSMTVANSADRYQNGVGLAATVARGSSSIALNDVRGLKAVLAIGGGIGVKIVNNTIKIMRQPDKLVIPGLESQTTPEIQAMFSALSPQYQMVVNQYLIIRHKFKSGTLTISDFLEFNSMLLVEFNVLDWTLTSSLLQSDLVIPTCSQPRQTDLIKWNRTKRPHLKIRLLNEKSAELLDLIDRFRMLMLELEVRVR